MRRVFVALIAGYAAILCAAAQSPGAESSRSEAVAAFETMMPVLHHPRCLVCHSAGDYPRQGDDLHPHIMDVRRGPKGDGAAPVLCSTCHQGHNLVGAHMPPGAPDWQLPPPDNPMIWEGLSARQLCELLTDSKRNGGRDAQALEAHMHTPLVLWGWHPGEGRDPVPMPEHTFLAKVHLWTSAGAPCPRN
jgi:hypothetical protein